MFILIYSVCHGYAINYSLYAKQLQPIAKNHLENSRRHCVVILHGGKLFEWQERLIGNSVFTQWLNVCSTIIVNLSIWPTWELWSHWFNGGMCLDVGLRKCWDPSWGKLRSKLVNQTYIPYVGSPGYYVNSKLYCLSKDEV